MTSIIIPIYNTIEYLEETVQCILNQSLQDYEVLFIDDGSRFDLTPFIKDNRFKVFSQEHGGVSKARNLGLDNAKGDYILCLDSDDLITNNYIEESVKLLEEGYSLVRPLCCYFGTSQVVHYSPWKSYKNELKHNQLFISSMFKKTDCRFDENLSQCEDWEFFVSYLYKNDRVIDCNDIRLFYRQHKTQTTNKVDIIKPTQYIYKKHKGKYVEYNEGVK